MHPLTIADVARAKNAERIKEAESSQRTRLRVSRPEVRDCSEQRQMATRLRRLRVLAPSALRLPTSAPATASPMARIARPPSRWWARRDHPVLMALTLAIAATALTISVAVIGQTAFPDIDPILVRLVAVLLMATAACLIVARAGAWSAIGAAGPTTWSRPSLLLVPALIALAPLATGLNLPTLPTLGVLITGYAATGVFEELWHRGVILDTLRTCGLRRSAAISGALFAASHLANIAFGQPVTVTLAQSVGAFCFGVGFAIFRWRTNALLLLVAIHAVGDLLLHTTNLHGGVLWAFLIGHDAVMLLWGLWCLRALTNDLTTPQVATAH